MSTELSPTALGISKDLPLLRRTATVAASNGQVVIRHLHDEVRLEGIAAHIFNRISPDLAGTTGIEAIDRPFAGYFQSEKYWYERDQAGEVIREPVTLQRVRALITEPGPDQEKERGDLLVRGVAWSGAAPIARVEVGIGDGPWQGARLLGERRRHSWQWWELSTRVDQPGTVSLRARATDLAGRTQPDQPEWNRFGYGSNAVQEVSVHFR